MRTSANAKRDTWRLVIQSTLLLSTFFVAYGSKYEIINAVIGMHFVHVITIALISINTTTDPVVRDAIDHYFTTYATINVTVDGLALILVGVRTALASRLNIYLTIDQLIYIVLYVIHVIALISVDIYNLATPLSATVSNIVDTFLKAKLQDVETGQTREYIAPVNHVIGGHYAGDLKIRIPPLRLTPHPNLRHR